MCRRNARCGYVLRDMEGEAAGTTCPLHVGAIDMLHLISTCFVKSQDRVGVVQWHEQGPSASHGSAEWELKRVPVATRKPRITEAVLVHTGDQAG